LTGNYKRSLKQTAGVSSVLSRFETLIRKCVMTAGNSMSIKRLPAFFRNVSESIKAAMEIKKPRSMIRKCNDTVSGSISLNRLQNAIRKVNNSVAGNTTVSRFETIMRKCAMTAYSTMNNFNLSLIFRNLTENITVSIKKYEKRTMLRKCVENIGITSVISKMQHFFRVNHDRISAFDIWSFPVLFIRSMPDTIMVSQSNRKWGTFIRDVCVNAESIAETTHKGEYYRFNTDTVPVAGTAVRSLFMIVRIISKIFIRDYLLGRFLIAREELRLKSAISREIILDSKII